jgi:mono/diheme cytochrome c family protein
MKPSLRAAVALAAAALAMVAARPASRNDVEGRVLYTRYCAACHGLDGDGHGPVASVLVPPVANLRRLGERYGLPLDVERVARFIDGRTEVTAHGTRVMPVWGERFAAPEPEASGRPPAIDARIRKIVAYLATIQQTGGGPMVP